MRCGRPPSSAISKLEPSLGAASCHFTSYEAACSGTIGSPSRGAATSIVVLALGLATGPAASPVLFSTALAPGRSTASGWQLEAGGATGAGAAGLHAAAKTITKSERTFER